MKTLLTLLILAGASVATVLLVLNKPAARQVAPTRPVTRVEVVVAEPQAVQLTVNSQGNLLPRTESDLYAEVSGRIIEVSESFRAGGSFRQGEVLLRIDPADYEAAEAAAAAGLASEELALAQEQAEAEQAAADWAALGQGEASELTLRKPQLAQAEARVASARAQLKRARRDLARTEVTAPFDGRVLLTSADLGQYVSAAPAAPIARIYATDRAEIRLPVTIREADLLELGDHRQSYVRLQKANNPDSPIWDARFARMEATIDPGSRLLYAVAELENPFAPNSKQPEPLRRGQFMTARIEGRRLSAAYVLPSYALRGSDTVYLVTEQNTLETRKIHIIQSNADQVIITQGLQPGDRVTISPIAYFVEGMPVQLIADNDGE